MKSHSLNELKEGPCIKETKKMRLSYINSTMEDALKQLKKKALPLGTSWKGNVLRRLKDGGSLKHNQMRGCHK